MKYILSIIIALPWSLLIILANDVRSTMWGFLVGALATAIVQVIVGYMLRLDQRMKDRAILDRLATAAAFGDRDSAEKRGVAAYSTAGSGETDQKGK